MRLNERVRTWHRIALLLALSNAAGCAKESEPNQERTAEAAPMTRGVGGCNGSIKEADQGEILGNVYENGLHACDPYSISLAPLGSETTNRLHMASFNGSGVADPLREVMFEWWDPESGGQCRSTVGTVATYVSSGAMKAETTHVAAAPGTKEGHCVRAGRYAFSGAGRSFTVDYIQVSRQDAYNAAIGKGEHIEATSYIDPDTPGAEMYSDLWIHTDLTSTSYSDAPVLHIQNATSAPYSATFTNDANPSGTSNDWFRFSVASSSSTWNIEGDGTALARLYFDGTDTTKSTGYYDPLWQSPNPIMRVYRFPNPAPPYKDYVVGLELMRPDEAPNAGPTVTRTVRIYSVPVACASFEGTTTWKVTDQIFNGSCSSGASLEYRWRTEAGGGWTSYAASPLYDFGGHGTAGSKQVTLEVRSTVTGLTDDTTYTFTVQDSVLTMTGPTYITDKLSKTYTANYSSYWIERVLPAGSWSSPIGPQVTKNRIFGFACHDFHFRGYLTGGTALKRSRLIIQVRNDPTECPPGPPDP